MENMDKGFTVPKWAGADSFAENTPKFICPSPKVWDFDEKKASLGVRSTYIDSPLKVDDRNEICQSHQL